MDAPSLTFGQRVRKLREELGYSLTELARRSDISRSYLYQLESDTSSPTQDKIEALAKALGVSVPDLLGISTGSLSIPDTLSEFRDRYRIPEADVRMLAAIEYRGKRPDSVDEWRILYNVIRATLQDDDP